MKVCKENIMKFAINFKPGEKELFKTYLNHHALKTGDFVRILIMKAIDKPDENPAVTTQEEG
jgi:hypothetical protein